MISPSSVPNILTMIGVIFFYAGWLEMDHRYRASARPDSTKGPSSALTPSQPFAFTSGSNSVVPADGRLAVRDYLSRSGLTAVDESRSCDHFKKAVRKVEANRPSLDINHAVANVPPSRVLRHPGKVKLCDAGDHATE